MTVPIHLATYIHTCCAMGCVVVGPSKVEQTGKDQEVHDSNIDADDWIQRSMQQPWAGLYHSVVTTIGTLI